MAHHPHPRDNNTNQSLGAESEETDITWGKFGFGNYIDGGMDIATESLNAAGPCPVGRDEGLSKGFEELRKREDGSAEGELKANQVDGKEGRLLL